MTDEELDRLAEFVAARFNDVDAAAHAAAPGPWRYDPDKHFRWPGTCQFEESVFVGPAGKDALSVVRTGESGDPESMADAAHVALHDPARALREVTAWRTVLAAVTARPHYYNDGDPWYSCALADDGGGPGSGCIDDRRRDEGRCDCGRDRLVAQVLGAAAGIWSGHPDYKEAWRI